jgi:phosphoglycolate phosphatase
VSARATFVVEAVAFDLDGTLLDTIHDLAASVNRLLGDMGLAALPAAHIRDLVGRGMANLVRRAIVDAGGGDPDEAELARVLARYQTIYALELGQRTVLFDGVVDGLCRLRDAGLRLAVVTNKASRFVAPHLAHAGIAHFFDVAIGGDDVVAKKPDAAPLLLVARRLGIAPRHLLMVGDSSNDALSARAAGCPVLCVPYGYNEGAPVESIDCDGIVASVADVADFVRRTPDTIPA